MTKLNVAKFLISGAGLFILTGCSLASMPSGYSPIEQQTVRDLSASNYTPRSKDDRAAILTQSLFAQAAFWSREYDLNPADLEAAINLASTLRRLGNPHKSIEVAQTTRALYPRDVDLMAELAAALIADNNPKDALPIIDTALGQRPNMARLWSLKGAALDQFEQFTEARQHYSKGLTFAPNDPGIIANVGLSYALEGDPVTAEIWLRRAANMPGASASTRQNLSLVLGLQNKFDEAEKWARRDLDEQAAANNMSYIRTLRGPSLPETSVQRPIKAPTSATKTATYTQMPATNYQRPSPYPQTQRASGNYYQPTAKITSPATRLTTYGQVGPAKAGGGNVVSARGAALAAAKRSGFKQVGTGSYASTQIRQKTKALGLQGQVLQNRALQNRTPQNTAPQRMATQDVLGKISQNNMPKAKIAQIQQQQLAGRAQIQQQIQQQIRPYPYPENNQPSTPYGVTVTYPNTAYPQTAQAGPGYSQTPQTPQEQTVSQPARQRRR